MTDPHSAEERCFPWQVMHACERVRDVLDVVDGQLTAGMRPYVVTPHGAGKAEVFLHQHDHDSPEPASLLTAWNHVRTWRKALHDSDPEQHMEIVHAHSFASGMASVRFTSVPVYDLHAFVEHIATQAGFCEEKSWLARSFRVAEQFILARSCAVVVHSESLRQACIDRGADKQDIFLVPDPLPAEAFEASSQTRSVATATIFAADAGNGGVKENQRAITALVDLLSSFKILAEIHPQAALVLMPAEEMRAIAMQTVQQLGIGASVSVLHSNDESRQHLLATVDLVIAGATGMAETHLLYSNHLPNSSVLSAMANGRAVLAQDSPSNRNVSPTGRGCIWYDADGGPRPLAAQTAALISDANLRNSLGATARTFMQETHSLTSVGRQYDAVYRHAFSQKRDRQIQSPAAIALKPALTAGQ